MSGTFKVVALRDLGPMNENGYLLVCRQTNQGIVIDPGDEAPKIIDAIDETGASFASIYLTHTHIDHVLAVREVAEHTSAKLVLPKAEIDMYMGLPVQCEIFGLPPVQPLREFQTFEEGDELKVGELQGQILSTPGHSPGSSCFYFAQQAVLFGGDLLFRDGIGRMDLWGGSVPDMQASLKRIVALPADVAVYPGHGEATTIGRERAYNPFLTGQQKGGAWS